MATSRAGVLLLNLGSPESPEVPDVRRYLQEFLMDGRVLDAPFPVRWAVVHGLILPFRPKKSAEAYKTIWTPEGSPLVVTSKQQQELLQETAGIPIHLAMRYGNPSIASEVAKIKEANYDRLLIIPLYPHYAMSSYETVVVKTMEEIRKQGVRAELSTLQPFYQDADYIDALVENARPHLTDDLDRVLFSFHGIPVRHLKVSDPSRAHCQCVANCCEVPSPVQSTCYRHQCFQTVKAFRERAQLDPAMVEVSFQSRLGREPWLQPYTDLRLEEMPKQGIRKLAILCPAFVSDCLETLEEINDEGREIFMEAGGESFTYIPCLNDSPAWIQVLKNRVTEWKQSEDLAAGHGG